MSNLIKSNSSIVRTGGLGSLLKKDNALATAEAPVAQTDITYYNQKLKNGHVGFLIDATGSRSATWKQAQKIQSEMFQKVGTQQELELRLIHFKGNETPQDTGWTSSPKTLVNSMEAVDCQTGRTQILPSLDMYMNKPRPPKIIVLIGDCFEENEGSICQKAQDLKDRGIQVFAFHEDTPGYSSQHGERIYQQLAFSTNGAFAKFGQDTQLDDLCHAAAEYALHGADGLKTLAASGNKGALTIGRSMKLLPAGV